MCSVEMNSTEPNPRDGGSQRLGGHIRAYPGQDRQQMTLDAMSYYGLGWTDTQSGGSAPPHGVAKRKERRAGRRVVALTRVRTA